MKTHQKSSQQDSQQGSFKQIFSWRMLVILILGFASGLPLALTSGTLTAWMADAKVDLSTIGFFSLVGLPYTLKFLWAPFVDRYSIPVLGRRRGWILISQACLIAALLAIGLFNPAQETAAVAAIALAIAFFSANQDIVIDAYRREILKDIELGFGSALYINGYRVAMLVSGGVAVGLADHMPWSMVYSLMAAVTGICSVLVFFAPEPKVTRLPEKLSESIVGPFKEFLSRDGAITILLFILLYKVGDSVAGFITMPFYKSVGFSNENIAIVVKGVGLWAVFAGALLGGLLILKIGINRALWVFGVLQAVSTAFFAVLLHTGPSLVALGLVISFENLSGGMGTAAYSAYMAAQTNKKFTATQYALLTSLMGVPRVILAAPSGVIAERIGWEGFFIFCALIAIPGMLLLFKVAPWKAKLPPKEPGSLEV